MLVRLEPRGRSWRGTRHMDECSLGNTIFVVSTGCQKGAHLFCFYYGIHYLILGGSQNLRYLGW